MAVLDRISQGRRVATAVVVAVLALAGSTGAASDAPTTKTAASSSSRMPTPVGFDGAQPALDRRPPPRDTSQGGLLLDRRGFRRLPDVPGALETAHLRNNNRGQITGTYVDDSDGTPRPRGFLMHDDGRVTRIDVPGAAGTAPLGINDRSQVVGAYYGPDATIDPDTGEYSPTHGFVWARGHITTFDIPGATTTAAYEINNRGQIAGHYNDANGVQHGYRRDHRGRLTMIDHPNATDTPKLTGTRVVGIDDRGRLVGSYGDDAGLLHAYMWDNGQFTDINPPDGLQAEASQIDNRGRIIGRYLDATPKLRSFLLDRGRYTPIDAPNRCDTAAFGLNDRGQTIIAAPGTTDGSTCPPETAADPAASPATGATPDGAGRLGFGRGSQPGSEASGRGRSVADGTGGFIYRNGRYTPLDDVDGAFTAHVSLNNRGRTAGAVFRNEPALDVDAFVRHRQGDYTLFDAAPDPSTVVYDIDDRGTAVGLSGNVETGETRAFLRRPDGEIITVEVPGAARTVVSGINNRGAVVGAYEDAHGVGHAFVMERGRVTTIDPPDARDGPVGAYVAAFDVNDRGQAVGCYSDTAGTYHGFLFHEGRFTTIDPPGAANVAPYATTCAFGINNRGQVVGQYVDATGMLHGYLWQQRRGFETIDPPRGAPAVGPTGVRGTVAADINDHGDILLPAPGGLYKGDGPDNNV